MKIQLSSKLREAGSPLQVATVAVGSLTPQRRSVRIKAKRSRLAPPLTTSFAPILVRPARLLQYPRVVRECVPGPDGLRARSKEERLEIRRRPRHADLQYRLQRQSAVIQCSGASAGYQD